MQATRTPKRSDAWHPHFLGVKEPLAPGLRPLGPDVALAQTCRGRKLAPRNHVFQAAGRDAEFGTDLVLGQLRHGDGLVEWVDDV